MNSTMKAMRAANPMITRPTTNSLLPGENSWLPREALASPGCDATGADDAAVFVKDDVLGADVASDVLPAADLASGVLDDVGATTSEKVLISVKDAVLVMSMGLMRVREAFGGGCPGWPGSSSAAGVSEASSVNDGDGGDIRGRE